MRTVLIYILFFLALSERRHTSNANRFNSALACTKNWMSLLVQKNLFAMYTPCVRDAINHLQVNGLTNIPDSFWGEKTLREWAYLVGTSETVVCTKSR